MALSRSEQMARIRGADTSPELLLREALVSAGHDLVANLRTPAGRADLGNADRKVAVFVDGCFWHGCPDHYVMPRSRVEFWREKLARNVARDRRQTLELERLGWRVVRVWECDVHEGVVNVAAEVGRALDDATWAPEPRWCVSLVEASEEAAGHEVRHLVDLRDPALTARWVGVRSTRKRGRVVDVPRR